MKSPFLLSFRRTAVVVAAALTLVGGLLGCASGPGPLNVMIPGDVAGSGEVRVIEYLGSKSGEPVPSWLGTSVSDLEKTPEFSDSYVFRFALDDATVDDIRISLRSFAESRSIAAAIIGRGLAKSEGIQHLPSDLIDRAVRIIAAAEYAGTDRAGEFWVREEVVMEETTTARCRGWLLYSVPREQVHAGLVLAYDNAAASFPPVTEPELLACEALQVRFAAGL